MFWKISYSILTAEEIISGRIFPMAKKSVESSELYTMQPDYQLGMALERRIVGHLPEFQDKKNAGIRIPEIRYDNLYSVAIGLLRMTGQQEWPSIPTVGQLPDKVQIRSINGPGWKRKVRLGKPISVGVDFGTREPQFNQLLESRLTTPEGDFNMTIVLSKREGFDRMIPDVMNLTHRQVRTVEAGTSLPAAKKKKIGKQTPLEVSMRLEDYPAEKMRPRQTQLFIERPYLQTVHSGSMKIKIKADTVYFDSAGNIIR